MKILTYKRAAFTMLIIGGCLKSAFGVQSTNISITLAPPDYNNRFQTNSCIVQPEQTAVFTVRINDGPGWRLTSSSCLSLQSSSPYFVWQGGGSFRDYEFQALNTHWEEASAAATVECKWSPVASGGGGDAGPARFLEGRAVGVANALAGMVRIDAEPEVQVVGGELITASAWAVLGVGEDEREEPLQVDWSLSGNAEFAGLYNNVHSVEIYGMTPEQVEITAEKSGMPSALSYIWLVGVDRIQYLVDGIWYDLPQPFYVEAGTKVDFRALPDPVNAPSWPAGYPIWTGADRDENDYSLASRTFTEPETNGVKTLLKTALTSLKQEKNREPELLKTLQETGEDGIYSITASCGASVITNTVVVGKGVCLVNMYNERRQALEQTPVRHATDPQMQAWINSYCTNFVDYVNGPLAADEKSFLMLTRERISELTGLALTPEGRIDWIGTDMLDIINAFNTLKWTWKNPRAADCDVEIWSAHVDSSLYYADPDFCGVIYDLYLDRWAVGYPDPGWNPVNSARPYRVGVYRQDTYYNSKAGGSRWRGRFGLNMEKPAPCAIDWYAYFRGTDIDQLEKEPDVYFLVNSDGATLDAHTYSDMIEICPTEEPLTKYFQNEYGKLPCEVPLSYSLWSCGGGFYGRILLKWEFTECEDYFTLEITTDEEPADIICVNTTKTYTATVTPDDFGGTFKWDTSGTIGIVGPDNSRSVTVEGLAPSPTPGSAELKVEYTPGSNYTCYVTTNISVVKVELPNGDIPGENNTFNWYANGLFGDRFQVLPDPLNAEVFWFLSGLPMDGNTKVRWDPWDFINSRFDVGYGTSPDLEVTYEDLLSEYDDDLPPNNDWFGEKSFTVTVQGNTCAVRPVWFFFYVQAVRNNFDGSKMAAWYHYWKDGAVPALTSFEYDHELPDQAQHTWNLYFGDKYYIGFSAFTGVGKSIFDVVAGTYTETSYPDHKGVGIHGVAKLCAHEQWHGVLGKETRSVLLGGDGHTDTDGDDLSDAREDEIGTDPTVKDTCNLSSYTGGGADYSGYADYADQELFCRWKQEGVMGDESKDWSFPGMQSHIQP